MLGKSALLRSSAWVGVEVLTLLAFVSCGRLSGPEVDGAGARPSIGGVSAGGTPATGGGAATGAASGTGGGSAGLGSGPQAGGTSTGGIFITQPDYPADPGTCEHLPPGLVDPPCSAEDIVIAGRCFSGEVTVGVPLAGIAVPATGLSLVLLPASGTIGGAGGEGGAAGTSPLVLEPSLSPSSAGVTTETDFSIVEDGAEVFAVVDSEEHARLGYLSTLATEDGWYPHHIGMIAVTQGERILIEKRLIIEAALPCLVK